MPNWKKVLLSGSKASVFDITASNLPSEDSNLNDVVVINSDGHFQTASRGDFGGAAKGPDRAVQFAYTEDGGSSFILSGSEFLLFDEVERELIISASGEGSINIGRDGGISDGDTLGNLNFIGTGSATIEGPSATIQAVAVQDFSANTKGAKLEFYTADDQDTDLGIPKLVISGSLISSSVTTQVPTLKADNISIINQGDITFQDQGNTLHGIIFDEQTDYGARIVYDGDSDKVLIQTLQDTVYQQGIQIHRTNGNVQIGGSVLSAGTSPPQKLTVQGAISASGNLTIGGNSTIEGNASISGNITGSALQLTDLSSDASDSFNILTIDSNKDVHIGRATSAITGITNNNANYLVTATGDTGANNKLFGHINAQFDQTQLSIDGNISSSGFISSSKLYATDTATGSPSEQLLCIGSDGQVKKSGVTGTAAILNSQYSAGTGISGTGTFSLDLGDVDEVVVDMDVDYIPIIDGGATGDSKKESITDFVSSMRGTGLSTANGTLSVNVPAFMANGSDDRIITATGTDGMRGETNLTYNDTDGLRIHGNRKLEVGRDATSAVGIEIGGSRNTDGASYIDFWSDNADNDYDYRIIRNSGPNGSTIHEHEGTGDFQIKGVSLCNFRVYTNNTQRFHINSSGVIDITTPANASSADLYLRLTSGGVIKKSVNASRREIKDEIKTITPQLLEDFSKLNPVTFVFKSEPDRPTGGFIAEEVAKVNPRFAHYGPNYDIKSGSLDVENLRDDSIVPNDVDKDVILAACVAKIQELEAELKILKTKIQ
jgi:hypothetical protein